MMAKSSPQQIRQRFDALVEAFSSLERGQRTAIDSALCLDLIGEVAVEGWPDAEAVLDVGCGAGNYTVKLLQRWGSAKPQAVIGATLVDLSEAMLARARARVEAMSNVGEIETIAGDVREVELGVDRFDVAVAAAVLHHLRTDAQWDAVFAKIHRALRPGGVLFVYDLIEHEGEAVGRVMWRRYGAFLEALDGPAFREKVFAYIAEEDTPRPLTDQLDRMRRAGFVAVDVLHKHGCFAAYMGVKGL